MSVSTFSKVRTFKTEQEYPHGVSNSVGSYVVPMGYLTHPRRKNCEKISSLYPFMLQSLYVLVDCGSIPSKSEESGVEIFRRIIIKNVESLSSRNNDPPVLKSCLSRQIAPAHSVGRSDSSPIPVRPPLIKWLPGPQNDRFSSICHNQMICIGPHNMAFIRLFSS